MFKLDRKVFTALMLSGALAAAMTACTNAPKVEEVKNDTKMETTAPNEVNQNMQTEEEKDSAAETAIEVMLEGGEVLKDSATDSVNSEAFQEELDRSMQNFKDLSDFIFNGKEINGVTFDELSDDGKQYAMNALDSLDSTLEYLVPNYKERFREWITDKAADGLDTLSDLRDQGLELWEEIQTKRNTR